jgi:hypothetical protein
MLSVLVAILVIVWVARQFNETNSKKWFKRLRPTGYFLGAVARNVAADARALRRLPAEWRFHRQLKGR